MYSNHFGSDQPDRIRHQEVKNEVTNDESDITVQSAPKRHEEVKNEADKDEPIIKVQSATKRKSKHRAKIYSCNQSEYKAATKSHLKAHERSKHNGLKNILEMNVIMN